jgi:hypothetical protein
MDARRHDYDPLHHLGKSSRSGFDDRVFTMPFHRFDVNGKLTALISPRNRDRPDMILPAGDMRVQIPATLVPFY